MRTNCAYELQFEPDLQTSNGALLNLNPAHSAPASAENLLTAFDRALIRLVTQGLPDRDMAQRLGIAEDQVREALLIIFRKLAMAGLLEQLLYTETKTDRIAC
jgi:DNA-binding NarL/FixJ family response regulator